jgi:hypothetical protein
VPAGMGVGILIALFLRDSQKIRTLHSKRNTVGAGGKGGGVVIFLLHARSAHLKEYPYR